MKQRYNIGTFRRTRGYGHYPRGNLGGEGGGESQLRDENVVRTSNPEVIVGFVDRYYRYNQ